MYIVEWHGRPTGAPEGELDPIRNAENASILDFVSRHAYLMTGRVLDFGAGKPGTCRKPEPYKHLVPGVYCPYDIGDTFAGPYDSIMSTQVLHMVGPIWAVRLFRTLIRTDGRLLLTFPTNWDELEQGDLWRYTQYGMKYILQNNGFEVEVMERRAEVKLGSYRFPLGYGCIARAV